MISKWRFGADIQTFTAERKSVLAQAEEMLAPSARLAAPRMGLSGWYGLLLEEMLSVFDFTVKMETNEMSPMISDMRAEFKREMSASMDKAKRGDNPAVQEERLLRWAANVSVNAAIEAATSADPDPDVGVEWVTMLDEDVRSSHKELHGSAVPTGQTFEVDGEQLLYPGQPVGDPSVWINCRCVIRPTMLTNTEEFSSVETFANQSDPSPEQETAVIVALPREGDPLLSVASGDYPHTTLVYLGNAGPEGIEDELKAVADMIPGLMTDKVSGRGTLGGEGADVLLLDANASSIIRKALLDQPVIEQLFKEADDQFPHWIPHTTIGYPDSPALSEEIPTDVTYDRIAYWRGDQKIEVPFQLPADRPVEAVTASVTEAVAEGDKEDEFDPSEIEDVDPHVPWFGILAPEGMVSGDNRMFGVKSLTHRNLPIPIKAMFKDAQGHADSVIVGRIDKIWRDENNMVWGSGVFDVSENAYEAVRQIANKMMRGISVDVDSVDGVVEVDADGNEKLLTKKARISAATICAIPAFAEAFVALGYPEDAITASGEAPGLLKDGSAPKCAHCEETATGYVLHSEGMAFVPFCPEHKERAIADAEASTPGSEPDPGNVDRVGAYSVNQYDIAPVKTRDGKGWVTDPVPTQRITGYWVDGRGAAKIGWGTPGDFSRCESQLRKYVKNPKWLAGLCANLHYRALGVWPGAHSAEAITASGEATSVSLVASASTPVSAEYFTNPQLDRPTAVRVDADGRIYGHVAAWGTCHIGFKDACTTPPTSRTGYAFYQTGEVETDAGPVAVGQITMDGGHAPISASARVAAAHYDNTCTAVADVAAGEDEHGIWISGKMRDGLTEKQVHALRASALSGDWRRIQGNLEMVGVLAVNVPGFPIPRTALAASGHGQDALIASRIVRPEHEIDAIPAQVTASAAQDSKISTIGDARATFRAIAIESMKNTFK